MGVSSLLLALGYGAISDTGAICFCYRIWYLSSSALCVGVSDQIDNEKRGHRNRGAAGANDLQKPLSVGIKRAERGRPSKILRRGEEGNWVDFGIPSQEHMPKIWRRIHPPGGNVDMAHDIPGNSGRAEDIRRRLHPYAGTPKGDKTPLIAWALGG